MLSSNDRPLRGVLVRRENFIILSGKEEGNGQQ
jgi:hypothetical protein